MADLGQVLTRSDYDRFLAEVPAAEGFEVDATHFTVAFNPQAINRIAAFLDAT